MAMRGDVFVSGMDMKIGFSAAGDVQIKPGSSGVDGPLD